MKVYDELVARGLIAQVTNEAEIREMVDNGKATFYIGFDPTADSLHVGHFMALCLMKRLQMAGNQPIALIGGGTAMIGDPSGRTDMRSMMTKETIEHNCQCFKKQMERFIEFGPGELPLWRHFGRRNGTRKDGADHCLSVYGALSGNGYAQPGGMPHLTDFKLGRRVGPVRPPAPVRSYHGTGGGAQRADGNMWGLGSLGDLI